ncbi:alpha-1A adrenergic receptor-like [Montipora capricornis]|uniref:alpha-1A adrenergic receptor-like n=1 Tax=Montipora foliosa TaxID=591990 RepID=UPI0035F1AE51
MVTVALTGTPMANNISGNASFTASAPLFYTDFRSILGAVAVGSLIVLTIAGNAIVCASFYTFRDLRTICNYFIISLAISDILVAILGMPFWLILQLTDLSNPKIVTGHVNIFWNCMDIFFGTASIMNLAAVSVDRHVAITAPFTYPYIMTPSKALLILTCAWFYAIVPSSLRLLEWPQPGGYQYFVFVASFLLPLMFMIAMYSRIYIVARRQAQQIRQGMTFTMEVKAAKTIAVVIGAFVFCWAPFFISSIVFMHKKEFFPIFVFKCAKWLEYLNSCLNPVLYTCLNKTYRKAFKRLFRRWRGKLERSREESVAAIGTLSRRLTLPRGSIFSSQGNAFSLSSGNRSSNGECRRKFSRCGSRNNIEMNDDGNGLSSPTLI